MTLWREKYLWILVLPGILWYLIFHYRPMYGLIIAFKDFSPYRGIMDSPWVGLLWFRQFFSSHFFFRLIRNTFLLNFYGLIWGFPVPILLALLLNEIGNRSFKRVAQTISYLPHFVSTVVVVGMMVNFLDTQGIVNHFLQFIGYPPVNFMVKPEWFRTLYISSGIWQSAGWSSIIYIAALSGIDPQLYEAATVDGAGKIKKILHVSIPGILPTIVILLILNIGNLLNVGFEKVFLMYNSVTYETADVISTYVYRRGIVSGEFSFGTAVGFFKSVINFVMIVSANKMAGKMSEISLW